MMTPERLETYPSLNDIEEFKELETSTIYIKSPIMRGVAGLLIESVWRVDYVHQSIHFVNASLISHYEKIPLSPFDIPDRHLRSARRIGAALFEVKRFDKLDLFKMKDLSTGYVVTRDKETRLFVDHSDARLWAFQRGGGGEIRTKTLTEKSTREAQYNSAEIRTQILRLMTQAMTGIGSLERIKTLKKRGVKLKELEKIWCDAHGREDIPAALRSIIYD